MRVVVCQLERRERVTAPSAGGVPRLALSFGEAGGEFGAAAGGVVGAEADDEEAAERVLEAQIG